MSETYVQEWSGYLLDDGWATIDYADSLDGYEWDEVHVLRGPDGRLYVGADGGCSCNSFGDADPADFTPCASWQEAAEAVRAWAQDCEDYLREQREGPGLDLIQRLTQKRPAARIGGRVMSDPATRLRAAADKAREATR